MTNTVLLSTEPVYSQSVKYNDVLIRESNVLREGGDVGPKHRIISS